MFAETMVVKFWYFQRLVTCIQKLCPKCSRNTWRSLGLWHATRLFQSLVDECLVGEGLQKCDELSLLFRCQFESGYQRVGAWAGACGLRVGAGTATRCIVIQDFLQGGNAAIVHIRSGKGNVAKGGCPEFAHEGIGVKA